MTARWVANTAYSAGTIILPTVDNGRCFYASVGGTSSAVVEPTWPGRFPGVADGTVTWVPYTVVLPSTLRDMNGWTTSTGVWSDTVLGNHLLDSIGEIEKTTRRFFVNHPGASLTWTSMLRAILPIPGLRTPTSVTWAQTLLTAGAYWLLPDGMQTGIYTGIQFRALRVEDSGPWWLADSQWFDKALDSPFYPGNYGGGYAFTSMPNDTIIVGDWGYAPGSEPNAFVHALEVFASFEAERRLSLLADSAITPQGGVLSYSSMPDEVKRFCADWSAGQQVVSIG